MIQTSRKRRFSAMMMASSRGSRSFAVAARSRLWDHGGRLGDFRRPRLVGLYQEDQFLSGTLHAHLEAGDPCLEQHVAEYERDGCDQPQGGGPQRQPDVT